jgi:hypothetical protein
MNTHASQVYETTYRIYIANKENHLTVIELHGLDAFSAVLKRILKNNLPYLSFSWIPNHGGWFENKAGYNKIKIEHMVGLVPITYYNYIK